MTASPSPLEREAPLSYSSGDVVAGKYALEELLGQGGMGAVFRARNISIDMPVAIKLIRADLDRELLSGRLLQEARAAAQLTHPAIVRVFDVGQTEVGDPFIVMELLLGASLATLLERVERLSCVRAIQLLLPIADALSAAHAKGFVHRDVKPDNVFIVDDDGQVQPKLVDFGIVKLEPKGGEGQLTQVGAVLGSPEYMSPEQARGLDDIDLRSDVWSFSVMLYEAISGHTPFSSKNYNALLRMIVENEPPSLHELGLADPLLSAVVARGMTKDPARRWPSIGQMGKALAGWLSDAGVTEDACGISLEAKWLSRVTDPSFSGRASRSSIPDGWPEPPSGMRTVRASLANAPTLHAREPAPTSSSSLTPASTAATSSTSPARSRKLTLVALGVAALLGALLVQRLVARALLAPEPAGADVAVPQLPAPPLAPAPVAGTELAQPSLAEAPAVPVGTLPIETSRPKLAKPQGAPAPATAPRASSSAAAAAPASDLLQPY